VNFPKQEIDEATWAILLSASLETSKIFGGAIDGGISENIGFNRNFLKC
jgi:hypothetical protein